MSWPKLPLNGSSGLFKRKLSCNERSLTKEELRAPFMRVSQAPKIFGPPLETKTGFSNF